MNKKRNILIALSYVLLIGVFSAWHIYRANSLEEESYYQGFDKGKQEGLQEGKEIGYNDGYDAAIEKIRQALNKKRYKSYNNFQVQPTRCIHCSGRGVKAHSMCGGRGCNGCDNTGLEACFFCQGKGYN